MADLLSHTREAGLPSHTREAGLDKEMLKSIRRSRNQVISQQVEAIARYSASAEGREAIGYFFEREETRL